MVASFCLRLAAGMIWMLPLMCVGLGMKARKDEKAPPPIPPRFFRVHFLTALGLLAIAGVFLREQADGIFWGLFAFATLGCVIGSILWHLDGAPGGVFMIGMTPILLALCMGYARTLQRGDADWRMGTADDFSSALVLGSAITAMLMGHSYLISPAMSMAPLMRLLGALAVSVVIRIGLAAFGLWTLMGIASPGGGPTDLWLWLPVRWVLGFIAPLVLGWMAYETARIRSTQSATGILYVVVIVCFLGELTSQLLVARTGLVL